MSTTAPAAPTPTTIPAGSPPPQVDVGSTGELDADGFSAAEREYFESRGTKTEGLTGTPPATAAPTAPAAAKPATTPEDEPIDGEVVIDEGGRVKDAKTGRFVPHAAHHALRERFKAQRTELEQTREKYARIDERIATINQVLGVKTDGTAAAAPPAPAADDEPEPNPETDLFAHNKWLAKKVAALSAELSKTRSTTEKRHTEQQYRDTFTRDAAQFMTAQPDFITALKNLREGRHAELEAVGMSDAAQRAAQVAREEREIVQAAITGKQRPAEVLYKLAKARGYKPAATPSPTTTAPAATPPAIDNAARIEQIAAGQKQASSAFSLGGGTAGEGLTRETLAAMSEAEFDAAVAKMSATQRRQLFGG